MKNIIAYVLGGADGEAFGFTTAISNFALRAMHESIGLVNLTNVVAPTQGNQFLVPNFAPITMLITTQQVQAELGEQAMQRFRTLH